jgi:fructosamine-3-kinase
VADLAEALRAAAGAAVTHCTALGGGHGARHYRAQLADGRKLFVKEAADDGGIAALDAEAWGLRWLAEAAAVPVPEIIGRHNRTLALVYLPAGRPEGAAAERFGRDLAALHAASADSFGAPWAGFIASLPLPNEQADSWPSWYAEHRLLPYCRLARDAGTLGAKDVALIESVAGRIAELAGPAEPPARIHGDCWSGNVLWSGGRAWLIDPAAHGGHRETDLAMLALFGAPYLDRILPAYQEVTPLAPGWQARLPLHQLHPLLVHVCLFGGGYRESALAAARAALAAG